MSTIGKLSEIPWERDFEWRVENFSSLPAEVDEYYESPLFYFANASWCLSIYPIGEKSNDSTEYIGLYLTRICSGPPISLDYSLILKTGDQRTYREFHTSYAFEKGGYGSSKFIERSEFLERRFELELPDVLTVICTMKVTESTGEAGEIKTAVCSHCQKISAAENVQFHEGKCLDKPIKCPECCDVIKLRDWYDHECQKFRSKVSEKLSCDLKEMLLNKDDTDTIIKVKGVEFPLHRNILVARNPYFKSMFKSDMKEKNTGVVTIDDCDPDIFRTFVLFIYTGKVDKLSVENVCDLYETADKHQEDQLKEECRHFMLKELCEDTFCDFIVMALKYYDKQLFEKSVELFTSKPKEIVRSVKWQVFVKSYPTQANELFIKTLDQYNN